MELKEYTCLAKRSESETVIKKSRFICALIPVESERQAAEELLKVRKKHYNATHNCSAMILKADASFEKSSDDGEPQGTAGLPMLEVLRHSGLTNILAVVTRYFGGTLLGAGGLARAYGASVTRSLSEAKKVRMIPAIELGFTVEYADYSKLQSIAGEYGAQVTAEFTDKVCLLYTSYVERELTHTLLRSAPAYTVCKTGDVCDLFGFYPFAFFGYRSRAVMRSLFHAYHFFYFF